MDQDNSNNPPPTNNPPNPRNPPRSRASSPQLELSLSHNPPPPPPPPPPPRRPQPRPAPPHQSLRLDLTISPPNPSADPPSNQSSPLSLSPLNRRKRTRVLPINTPGPSSAPSSFLSSSSSPTVGSSSRTGPLTGDHLSLASPGSNPFSRQRDNNAAAASTPCTECGRTFKSLKALYGHMRCHPERPWRGINPPAGSSSRQNVPVLPSPPPTPAPAPNTDKQLSTGLLLLSHTAQEMARKRANAAGAGTDAAGRGTDAAGRGTDVAGTSADAGGRFECSSCKKTFPTFQALGGHRASHKNVKGCYASNRAPSTSAGPQAMDVDGTRNDTVKDSGSGAAAVDEEDDELGLALALSLGHRCSICMRVFPTGQALGGHMRSHYDQPSSSTPAGPGDDQVMRDAQSGVDLNQPGPSRRRDDGSSSPKSDSDELDLSLGL